MLQLLIIHFQAQNELIRFSNHLSWSSNRNIRNYLLYPPMTTDELQTKEVNEFCVILDWTSGEAGDKGSRGIGNNWFLKRSLKLGIKDVKGTRRGREHEDAKLVNPSIQSSHICQGNLTLLGQNFNLKIGLHYFKLECSGPAGLAPSKYARFVKDLWFSNHVTNASLYCQTKATPELGFEVRCAACT